MSSKEIIKHDLDFRDDTVTICLFYPDVEDNEIKKIEVGLIDVRAADNIQISYDKQRDGWVIKQASIFSFRADDNVCDPDWQEVAFIKAWAREKKGVKL